MILSKFSKTNIPANKKGIFFLNTRSVRERYSTGKSNRGSSSSKKKLTSD
jgi:hypothetical protein